jgi:glutamate-1-semialdehyde 2,1-aminomutase
MWTYTDLDREIFERELESFVPPRVFDAHAHLYDMSHLGDAAPALLAGGPSVVGLETYQKYIEQITPGRKTTGLFFGFPAADVDIAAANGFVSDEIRRAPESRGQMLIRPEMEPESIRDAVRQRRFAGLKCYHVFAAEKPTFDAPIRSYLPEAHVRIAHEEKLSITLHIVRSRGLADRGNQETIVQYATRYPSARLILAHAARGFNPHHTIEGIHALAGLRNVWCDTSAVTDGGAFEAIIRVLGVDRLLYGSDFPVSHLRGRCVAMGDSFIWLTEQNVDFRQPMGDVTPTLVGLESLRVLKLACINMGLSDSQIEHIFFGNAAELFGVTS